MKQSVFIWPFFYYYIAFAIFAFYQKLHMKHYKGSSKGFETALVLSVTVGSLTGIGLLIYYAVTVSWWPPIVMLVCSLITVGLISVWIEILISPFLVSMIGFIGWPICVYLMYSSLR